MTDFKPTAVGLPAVGTMTVRAHTTQNPLKKYINQQQMVANAVLDFVEVLAR
jgi:hypothetical protein